MTKKQQQVLAAYTRAAADAIGLRDWAVELDFDNPSAEGDGGDINWPEGRKSALIGLAGKFMDYDPEEQRYIVVHELVHCHFASMQDTVEEDLQPHLSRPTYDIYSRSFRRSLEYGVDAVAHALAANLPLIEWPK